MLACLLPIWDRCNSQPSCTFDAHAVLCCQSSARRPGRQPAKLWIPNPLSEPTLRFAPVRQRAEERDPETYDDAELYQQLLKEFLESSAGAGGRGTHVVLGVREHSG